MSRKCFVNLILHERAYETGKTPRNQRTNNQIKNAYDKIETSRYIRDDLATLVFRDNKNSNIIKSTGFLSLKNVMEFNDTISVPTFLLVYISFGK